MAMIEFIQILWTIVKLLIELYNLHAARVGIRDAAQALHAHLRAWLPRR